jgi:WD40 repeat protein
LLYIDADTKSVSTDLGCAEWNNRGHSNRIFSIKFIDDNTIISGGWDSVIHLWDIRQGKSVQSVFGPHVAGDSIDHCNGEILIGCYAAKNQIQVWDLKKFVQKDAITWTSTEDKDKVAYVYSAGFGYNLSSSETMITTPSWLELVASTKSKPTIAKTQASSRFQQASAGWETGAFRLTVRGRSHNSYSQPPTRDFSSTGRIKFDGSIFW